MVWCIKIRGSVVSLRFTVNFLPVCRRIPRKSIRMTLVFGLNVLYRYSLYLDDAPTVGLKWRFSACRCLLTEKCQCSAATIPAIFLFPPRCSCASLDGRVFRWRFTPPSVILLCRLIARYVRCTRRGNTSTRTERSKAHILRPHSSCCSHINPSP